MVFRARNTLQGPVLVRRPGYGVPPAKAVLCSRAPPPPPPSRPSCSFPANQSLSPTFIPPPGCRGHFLFILGFCLPPSLCVSWLLPSQKQSSGSPAAHSPTRGRGWVGSVTGTRAGYSCPAVRPPRPPARLRGIYLCVRCTP